MMPHEWVQTGGRWLETDATDHHDDHFFPGPQDIAWDLAAAALEFELSPAAELWMRSRFRLAGGDADVARRLPFYRVAYLAFAPATPAWRPARSGTGPRRAGGGRWSPGTPGGSVRRSRPATAKLGA